MPVAAYLPLLPIYIHLVVLQMGGYFSSIIEWASFGKHAQILILGLDASGKTTIINRLKTGTHAVTVPTIGFNSETIASGPFAIPTIFVSGYQSPHW